MADDETKATDKGQFLGLERAEWWLCLQWVLASMVGGAVAMAVSRVVGTAMDLGVGPTASVGEGVGLAVGIGLAVGEVVGGVVGGTAQWLVLRKRIDRSGGWVLFTAVGWAVVGAVGGIVGWSMSWAVFGVVGGIVFGVVGGTAQRLVLRSQVGRSGWWVLASIVSWAVGRAVGVFVGWLVAGAITGFALIVLLRQPVSGERDPQQKESAETKPQFWGLERAEWWFWIKWVLATVVGGAVGVFVGMLVREAVGVFVGLAVGWVVGGTAQWMVLRKRVHRSGCWVLATAVGGLVGGSVGWLVAKSTDWLGSWLVGGFVGLAVGWAAGGTAQWIVLRKRVRRSGWWVLATAVGGPVGVLVGPAVGMLVGLVVGSDASGAGLGKLGTFIAVFWLTTWTVALVVGGAITGCALTRLLRHPNISVAESRPRPLPPSPPSG